MPTILDRLYADPRVAEVWPEDEVATESGKGWWLTTNSGWACDPETHTMLAETLSKLYFEFKERVHKCECQDCVRGQ